MRNSLLLLLAGVTAIAACSSDSSTTAPTSGGTDDSVTTTTGITIVVDSATNNDTAGVATVIPARVHISQSGSALAGVTVIWTVASGHGTISAVSSVSDATGLATVNWTLGDTAGTNTLTAAITNATVTVTAVGVGDIASVISKVSADSAAVVAGAALPLTAKVTDRLGNPVLNATVVWSSSDGSLSTTSSLSGINGDATSNFTTPTTPGTYTVTATLPNIASVTFKIVAQ